MEIHTPAVTQPHDYIHDGSGLSIREYMATAIMALNKEAGNG